MARVSLAIELEEAERDRLSRIAADQGVSPSELIERMVAGNLAGSPVPGRHPWRPPGSPGELYRWDEQKGAVLFTPTNRRVFILNARAWALIEQDLLAYFMKDASPLLLEMGYSYGRATALDYRLVTDDPDHLASYFEHLGQSAGWGKFSLSGDLTKGSRVMVRVHDCVFCATRNPSAERTDSCRFIMGVCKGIADAVFGFQHYVYESRCFALGNGFCEIVVGRATDSEKAAWRDGRDTMNNVLRHGSRAQEAAEAEASGSQSAGLPI